MTTNCLFFIILTYFIFYNFEYFCERYRKFQTLKSLVSLNEKNSLIIYYKTVSVIFKSYYLSFLQYINNSVKPLGNNTYEISYTLNNKIYKFIVKQKKGPHPVSKITGLDNQDITNEIIPFIGPNHDWHNYNYSPLILNHNNLKIHLSNGNEKNFLNNEILKLNF